MRAYGELRMFHRVLYVRDWKERAGLSQRHQWRDPYLLAKQELCHHLGDIYIPSRCFFSKRGESMPLSNFVKEIADTIVTMNPIRRHRAAGAMVAKYINDLLAECTTFLFVQNR